MQVVILSSCAGSRQRLQRARSARSYSELRSTGNHNPTAWVTVELNCLRIHWSCGWRSVISPWFLSIPRPATIPHCAIRPLCSSFATLARLLGPGSVRSMVGESLLNYHLLNVNHFDNVCHETHGQTHPFHCTIQSALVLFTRSGAPGGFELPAFWFVGKQSKILSAAPGVAYRGTRHLSRS
jgi:hypothetical protein